MRSLFGYWEKGEKKKKKKKKNLTFKLLGLFFYQMAIGPLETKIPFYKQIEA